MKEKLKLINAFFFDPTNVECISFKEEKNYQRPSSLKMSLREKELVGFCWGLVTWLLKPENEGISGARRAVLGDKDKEN